MLAILPVISFLGCWKFLNRRYEWRPALLMAATAWGLLVVLITEGLSQIRSLTRPSIAICWLLAAELAMVGLFLQARYGGQRTVARQPEIKAGLYMYMLLGAIVTLCIVLCII